MEIQLIFAILLLAFLAIYNTREFLIVLRVRKDKEKFIDAHSQIGEGAEFVAFILTAILLYFSNFSLFWVLLLVVVGLVHVQPTITSKEGFSKMPDEVIGKMGVFVVFLTAFEVLLSLFVISRIVL